jgi:hypothetical protein
MAKGAASSPRLGVAGRECASACQNLEVDDPVRLVLFEHGLERIDALADARRERMVEGRGGRTRRPWACLVFGGHRHGGLHVPVRVGEHVVAQADGGGGGGADSPGLFTVGSLEYPFSGGTRVGPEAFDLVLQVRDQRARRPPITYQAQSKSLRPVSTTKVLLET